MAIQGEATLLSPLSCSAVRRAVRLCAMKLAAILPAFLLPLAASAVDANRLTYLDSDDPFYPHAGLARLATPQWIGEQGVEAVVILSIDDLRQAQKYEDYLRPVIERLQRMDGRAPVSILCCEFPPTDPLFQRWLAEGLSLEVHTLAHPCPLLGKMDFDAAWQTVFGCVDLLAKIPGNAPVAFRMPCCDSMNSPSPRFYSEIFPGQSAEGRFLSIDSSIMCVLSDPDGGERFRKYFPRELKPPATRSFERFGAFIEDYPYPYVIGRGCWEFPCLAPSDFESFNFQGAKNPRMLEDWKAALDAVVLKQGVMTLVLHPHGWSDPRQIVELIDYAVGKYGKRVKFLNFREALERLEKNALGGRTLRGDGARLLDVDADGFLDVVAANVTRVWEPAARRWGETPSPHSAANARFGVLRSDGHASLLATGKQGGAWDFDEGQWRERPELLHGIESLPLPGVRLRDFDGDGRCELLASNVSGAAIFRWVEEKAGWEKADLVWPEGVSLVNERGEDNGLRFVDLNGDGFDDIVFSNEERSAIHLWAKNVNPGLGWRAGWSIAGSARRIPSFVRSGPHRNNGAWFRDGALFIQNEDTAKLDGAVDRRSLKELIAFDIPPPKSPEESLAAMKVRPGFKVELVAAEPLVVDPIAFDWDARGRMWVVEMRDYPLGLDGKGKPGGVVKILEDIDGDGRFDKATTFLEDLPFPTGVLPWRKGALIADAPDLIYAEDIDGDGRADVRRVLFTGFIEGNQQHRFNGLDYALDGWIYCANGDSGGEVKSLATGATVNIRGRDFRFRPDTGEIETVEGQAQFGRRCDDWGHWFGNSNGTWLWHYPIPERYVARNPRLAVKSLKEVLSNYSEPTRVFPVSAPMIRFNQPQSLNHVTSGCSPAPYRDTLFGPEFATSVFISEPVHNAVHREVLAPNGATFTSHRADDEQTSEFLASADNWFRPTTLKTGPDGALYIADMYRAVLEHPQWIAPETQARLDLRAGEDKGRIYRVVPADRPARRIPDLSKLDTAGLVDALESPSGWQRAMAQRLLIQGEDTAAAPLLAKLATSSREPKTRLHALWTLDGLGALTVGAVRAALGDQHPAVRETAVRLGEPLLEKAPASILESLAPLVSDAELRVRYQLAYSLGASRDARAGQLLARIAERDGEDPFMRIAVLSSATPHAAALVETLLPQATVGKPAELFFELLRALPADSAKAAQSRVAKALADASSRGAEAWQFKAAAALPDARMLDVFGEKARAVVRAGSDPKLSVAALGLLGRDSKKMTADLALLRDLLAPRIAPELHATAVATLGRIADKGAADVLLEGWKGFGPALRQSAMDVLLSRANSSAALLAAVEAGRVPAAEIGAAQRQALLKHRDAAIAKRAANIFAEVSADRQRVVAEYLASTATEGDAEKGRAIFRIQCALCHRLKGEGVEVGPDLGMVASKPAAELLTAILDPNQAIEPKYLAYLVTTADGRALAGIIASESANDIVLKLPGGSAQNVLRNEIKELAATARSLMPEGLEHAITPAQMTDLLSFLRIP